MVQFAQSFKHIGTFIPMYTLIQYHFHKLGNDVGKLRPTRYWEAATKKMLGSRDQQDVGKKRQCCETTSGENHKRNNG